MNESGYPSHPLPGVECRGADVGGTPPLRRAPEREAVPGDGICVSGFRNLSRRQVSERAHGLLLLLLLSNRTFSTP